MKKILMAMTACLACMQSVQAIPSNFGASLREYQAILDAASLLQTAISQNESIIQVDRLTKDMNAEVVHYLVETYFPFSIKGNAVDVEDHETSRARRRVTTKKYDVKLIITPNPQIGPPVISVVNIEPISSHANVYFMEDAEAIE